MADFVAVIRRTVDGLSENSPEMRTRVYEKARGAVRRQLENMKPRPSDEMIDRQMAKLEAAITDVEASNAEALPEDFPVEDAVPVAVPAPVVVAAAAVPEPTPEPEPEPEPEPTPEPEPEPTQVQFEQPQVPYDVSSVAPVEVEPVAYEAVERQADEPEVHAPEPVAESAYEEEPQAVAQEEPDETDAYHPVEPAEAEPYAAEREDEHRQPADPALDAAAVLSAEYARIDEPAYVFADTPASSIDDDDTVATEETVDDRADHVDAIDEDVTRGAPAPLVVAPVDSDPIYLEPTYPEPAYQEPVYQEPAYEEPTALEPEPVTEAPEPETPSLPQASWELPEWTDPVPDRPFEAAPLAIVDPFGPEFAETQPFEQGRPVPVGGHVEPVWTEAVDDAAVDEFAAHVRAEPVVVPPVSGGLTPEGEPSHSWALDETDPFQHEVRPESVEPAVSDWSWPVDRSAEVERTAETDEPPPPATWDEIDSLLAAGGASAALQNGGQMGGQGAGMGGGAQNRADRLSPDLAPAPPRPTSYRAEPRKSAFSLKRIVTVLLLLLVVGGGGYSYWINRTTVNDWVTGVIASLNTAPPQATNGPTASGSGGAASGTPATGNATTDVAAVPSSNKFTQRLQTDGSEIDDGPAQPPAGSAAAQEGKSVAAQTEASRPAETADATPATTPATTPAVTPDAAATPAGPPAGTPAGEAPANVAPNDITPTGAPDQATTQMPAGAQKMFLYEERLGQTAPTAIEGGVAWSLKEEAPESGQRPEPVIQAQITVPDRGLTALMTIKRNTDSSLPASHTIEFVFSLPENFEGGSIDSVQRVAMKRTEQDRGDPLIAVPAKITDDFHMIALNDFPEAVTTNLDLLRTRSWIDIPLTYRNGRRALLTLEKGAAGADAFNKALTAWSQARPAN